MLNIKLVKLSEEGKVMAVLAVKEEVSGVPWWFIGLRIQCYYCCGMDLTPGRELSHAVGVAKN